MEFQLVLGFFNTEVEATFVNHIQHPTCRVTALFPTSGWNLCFFLSFSSQAWNGFFCFFFSYFQVKVGMGLFVFVLFKVGTNKVMIHILK